MDSNYYYTCNGFILHDLSEAPQGGIIIAHARLLGGKGGFGSMLRAIGSQIEKTTNREMCRDLNGRRMRDVNNERRLKEWLAGVDDRQREQLEACLERRRKRKMLLAQGPTSQVAFEDATGSERKQRIAEELQDALEEAFEKRSKNSSKTELTVRSKTISFGVDSDLESSCSSSSSSVNDDENIPSPNIDSTLCSSHEISTTKDETDNSVNYEQTVDIAEEPKIKKVKIDEESMPVIKDTVKKVIEEEADYPDINLDNVGSVYSLLTYGEIWIKNDLQRRGLKCGGTLMERAQRLFMCKGLKPECYPAASVLAINKKRKR